MRGLMHCDKAIFPSDNPLEIPLVPSCEISVGENDTISAFDRLVKNKFKPDLIGHFFIDDYKFESVWKNPYNYLHLFEYCKAIIMPDFSLYFDYPAALQIYNKYRNHWLACYYAINGIPVIPCILPTIPDSLDFVSMGNPKGSVMAFSDIGMKYGENMIKPNLEYIRDRLEPSELIYFTRRSDVGLEGYGFNSFKIIRLPYIEGR